MDKTQEKLHASPTAGVAPEHSPYYRRLLSAGYKGHNQGMIGGATLYGTIGLVIGGVVAVATQAWMLAPILALFGAAYGAETFSHIGTQAAIAAEAAELNETRRALLDELDDTKDPEIKAAIREKLDAQLQAKPVKKFFHWKTLLIGAAFGATIALGMAWLAPQLGAALLPEGVFQALHGLHLVDGVPTIVEGISKIAPATAEAFSLTGTGWGIMGAVGALVGSIIGIDREYVRRWLDGAEIAVNDPKHVKEERVGRAKEVSTLKELTAQSLAEAAPKEHAAKAPTTDAPKGPAEQPDKKITDITAHARVAEAQRAANV